MYSSKHFFHLLNKTRRGIHLYVDSSGLENSCWEIRKETYKTNMTDRLPTDQRVYNHTWLKQLADGESSMMIDLSKRKLFRNKSIINERKDTMHYKPMSLKDRTYERTWDEYEISMNEFSDLPQTYIPMAPPVRKRNLKYIQKHPETQERIETRHNENSPHELDLGSFSLESSSY